MRGDGPDGREKEGGDCIGQIGIQGGSEPGPDCDILGPGLSLTGMQGGGMEDWIGLQGMPMFGMLED